MANLLHLQLVTPERSVLTEDVISLSCPTTEGQITLLPGHAPLVATLASGEFIAKTQANEHPIHVAGGFINVTADGTVIVLADAAEHVAEIDIERAEAAKQEAEVTLKEQRLSNEEYATTAYILQKNLSRIAIAKKHAHRRTNVLHEGVLKQ